MRTSMGFGVFHTVLHTVGAVLSNLSLYMHFPHASGLSYAKQLLVEQVKYIRLGVLITTYQR